MKARPISAAVVATSAFAASALFAAYAPIAGADTDPIPDAVEAVLCGSPQFVTLLNLLPAAAGECVDRTAPAGPEDYQNPAFTSPACTECTTATHVDHVDIPLTSAADTGPVPLPPVGVPSQETPATEPIDFAAGTVQGVRQSDGQHYCVYVTPEGRGTVFQCVDLGAAGAFVPNFGPTELVHVDSVDAPDTPAVDQGELLTVPSQHVPSFSYDLLVERRWVDSRLNARLGPGTVSVYEPVDLDDPAAQQWWADNGDRTNVHVRLVLRQDGSPVQTVELSVPYAGQLVAALLKSGIAL